MIKMKMKIEKFKMQVKILYSLAKPKLSFPNVPIGNLIKHHEIPSKNMME